MTASSATDEDTLELRLTRVLPATPDQVFDAYTDAAKQRIWFSILDATPGIVEIDVDLRVGGQQTAVWGRDRDSLFRETQTFLVIDQRRRDGCRARRRAGACTRTVRKRLVGGGL